MWGRFRTDHSPSGGLSFPSFRTTLENLENDRTDQGETRFWRRKVPAGKEIHLNCCSVEDVRHLSIVLGGGRLAHSFSSFVERPSESEE